MSAGVEEYRSRLRDALVTINQLKSRIESLNNAQKESIAIIGMACRFPGGGITPERFFQSLEDGVDAVTEVPGHRWALDPVSDDPVDRSIRWGAFLDQIDQFDAEFFGISPREAARLDPQQRLLLETTWEALERAGIVPSQLAGSRTGVFIGMMTNDYALVDAAAGREQQDAYSTTGNGHCFPAGRISFTLGFQGPSMVVDTACSSSLVAVHLACQSLRNRECDLAVVGGVNLMLSAETTKQFAKTRAFSPDGRCKTFDAAANGYVRGEGCGVLLLQRLSDAQKGGNPILALVRGSAVNQDGRSTGLTTPNVLAQELLIRDALANAGLRADDIGYVEAHGTGTPLGDPIEVNALLTVLGARRADGSKCRIGAVKTNIGHLEAAAGVAGLIKTVMMFQRSMIPRIAHLRTQNPRIDLTGSALELATKNTPWPRGKEPRRAGVSSFGMSGTNAHIILEEAPPQQLTVSPQNASLYALPLSGRTPAALTALARSYGAFLASGNDVALSDVIHTAATRRMHHGHRFVAIGRTRDDLVQKLNTFSGGVLPGGVVVSEQQSLITPKIVFVFPGQGSQWLGMGRQLLLEEPVFSAKLNACAAAIRNHSDVSILDEIAADAAQSRMGEIHVVQPLLFAIEVALAALLISWGIHPSCLVGHSMGEVAAAHVAGILSLDDAAKVICQRSALLKRIRGQGAMGLVELPMDEAKLAIAEFDATLSVAANNGPRSTVLSGDPDALETVLSDLERRGVFSRRIKVDVASHSPQVDPLRADLVNAIRDITPLPAILAMRSTVTTNAVVGEKLDADYWSDNLRLPVRFSQVIQDLLREDHTLFIELSPHPILIPSIEENARNNPLVAAIATMRRETDAEQTLTEMLATIYVKGYEVNWSKGRVMPGRAIPAPTYPWQRKRHWLELPRGSGHSRRRHGVHPLLGTRFAAASHPQLHVWEQVFTLDDFPFLNDHRVLGEIVFPTAIYVEMALAAANLVYNERSHDIEDFAFERMPPFTSTTRRIVQVSLEEKDSQYSVITISSREENEPVWTRHASGSVRVIDQQARDELLLQQSEDAREAKIVDAVSHYTQLESRGLTYGPTFQCVTELRQGATASIAHARLPNEVGNTTAYSIHPGLLEACFQVATALLSASDDGATYVPSKVVHMNLHTRPERNISIIARLREREIGGKAVSIVARDERGQFLFEIGEVLFQSVGTHRSEDVDPFARYIFDIEWRKTSAQTAISTTSATPKQWLIYLDSRGFGNELVDSLRSLRDRVVVVRMSESYERSNADEYRLNPSNLSHWEAVLADAFGKRGFYGAIHCGALDGTLWPDSSAATIVDDLRHGVFNVLGLARAISNQGWRDNPKLCVLTRAAQVVVDGDSSPAIAQAPLWGLGRVLAIEQPEIECLRIDLPSETMATEKAFVINEIVSFNDEDQVALRPDGRYVARIVNVPWDAAQYRKPGGPEQVTKSAEARDASNSTILIVGGNDIKTVALVQWLADQGIRHLAWLQSTAPSAQVDSMVKELNAIGTHIRSWETQLEQRAALDDVILHITREMPPLRGLVYVPSEGSDIALLELKERDQQETEAAILSAWNLHEATKRLALDFFVTHSTIAGFLGLPGKGNCAAIDAFLEAMGNARMADNLVWTNIRWGAIADTEQPGDEGRHRIANHQNASFEVKEAIPIFGRLLTKPVANVALMHFDVQQWVDVYPQMAQKPFLAELVTAPNQRPAMGEANFRGQLERIAPERRTSAVESHLVEHLRKILRLEEGAIDKRAPFASLGMDSLMSLELRNRLEASLGLKFSAALLFTYTTTASLAQHLTEKLFSEEEASAPKVVPNKSTPHEDLGLQDGPEHAPTGDDDETALMDKLSSFEEYLE